MKTASEELKSKNGVPVNPNAVRTSVSQPGPEDGRDQNIKPGSNSYDPAVNRAMSGTNSYHPDNGKSIEEENHNAEVHRTDEDDSFKSANQPYKSNISR